MESPPMPRAAKGGLKGRGPAIRVRAASGVQSGLWTEWQALQLTAAFQASSAPG